MIFPKMYTRIKSLYWNNIYFYVRLIFIRCSFLSPLLENDTSRRTLQRTKLWTITNNRDRVNQWIERSSIANTSTLPIYHTISKYSILCAISPSLVKTSVLSSSLDEVSYCSRFMRTIYP